MMWCSVEKIVGFQLMVSFSSLLLLHLTRLEGIIPKFFFRLSVSREKLKPQVGLPSVEKGATLLRRMVCGAPPSPCCLRP